MHLHKTTRSRRQRIGLLSAVTVLGATVATAGLLAGSASSAGGQYGESYNAKPALLLKALGTTQNVPKIIQAAITRGEPLPSGYVVAEPWPTQTYRPRLGTGIQNSKCKKREESRRYRQRRRARGNAPVDGRHARHHP